MRLSDKLNNLDCYPLHMPGHKRNPKFGIIGSDIDVTEINGLDDLHNPSDILLEVEQELQNIYKSNKSFLLVNGSTVGILSAIFSVCNEDDKIIIARNCHKSVYNACMLRHLRVVYLEPEFDRSNGYYTRVLQSVVDEAVRNNPDAKAVVITSPTYEGIVSNIKCNPILIIDAAHGAHFGLGNFPSYPNGDIVVSSLHKTLPALTQTAVLNVYNKNYITGVKMHLNIFQSSSPSYVLMNSAAICCEYIKNNRQEFYRYFDRLCLLREMNLFHLRLMYSDDYSKLVISSANTDITGVELADILRKKYSIEVEMAGERYIIAMTSVGDSEEIFTVFRNALEDIDSALMLREQPLLKKPPLPKGEHCISVSKKFSETPLYESIGRLSNEFVYAYPPDIPIISPNETVSREAVEYIISAKQAGVNIVSDSLLLPNKLLTKED